MLNINNHFVINQLKLSRNISNVLIYVWKEVHSFLPTKPHGSQVSHKPLSQNLTTLFCGQGDMGAIRKSPFPLNKADVGIFVEKNRYARFLVAKNPIKRRCRKLSRGHFSSTALLLDTFIQNIAQYQRSTRKLFSFWG